jgi:hypothetical protein
MIAPSEHNQLLRLGPLLVCCHQGVQATKLVVFGADKELGTIVVAQPVWRRWQMGKGQDNAYHTCNLLILLGSIKDHLCTKRIAEQIDASGVNVRARTQEADSAAHVICFTQPPAATACTTLHTPEVEPKRDQASLV